MSQIKKVFGRIPRSWFYALVSSVVVFLSACVAEPDKADPIVHAAPEIAYGTPGVDTSSIVSISVNSTGGAVTGFEPLDELPDYVTLDSVTGGITYQKPGGWTETVTFRIVCVGPGGRDTAEAPILMPILVGPNWSGMALQLYLKASAGYEISRIHITWTAPDTVVRDTIRPGQIGLSTSTSSDQVVAKNYPLKPLRAWTGTIAVFDTKDSVIYWDSILVAVLLPGQTRPVTVAMTPRYSTYSIIMTLPDSVRPGGSGLRQVLNVNRFRAALDGRTLADSLKSSGTFSAGFPAHKLTVPYVLNSALHLIEVQVFGVISGWPSDKPLYADTISVSSPDTTYGHTLPWTGPGSPQDPSYNPSSPADVPGLVVNIGKVSEMVVVPPVDPSPLFKR